MSVESIQGLKLENEKLQRDLDFARTLLESANSIIIRWDTDGIIHYMNDFGLRYFGYSSGELVGQHLLTIVPEVESSTGRDMAKLAEAIAKNPDQYITVPSENLTKDGRTVWVTWTNKGILDEQGNVREVLAIGNDITALKVAEQQLRDSQEKLSESLAYSKQLIDNSPVGLLVFRESGPCVRANPAAEIIVGASTEQMLELNFREMESYRGNGILADMEEALSSGTTIKREVHTINTFGKDVWFEGIISAFADGGEKYILFLFHDIMERKQSEIERENLVVKLQEKTEALEQFVYTVSHDLKSPLVTISGFLNILEQDHASANDDDFNSHLSLIKNAANRMKQLIAGLLEISRIGTTRTPLESVNLGVLINEAINNLSGLISETNATIEVASNLPDVKIEKLRLLQVFENLITNAVRYSKSQEGSPIVHIGATQSDTEVTCYVKDNGIGIEAQYLEKIFGLFEGLETDSDSTGVGLAIVKRIVEVHGGKIWAESEGLGHGTTFFFTLPEA